MVSVVTAILEDEAAMMAFLPKEQPSEAGALVTFVGMVRDHDGGRGVTELEYEGHPTAAAVMQEAAEDVAARFPKVSSLRVAHRIGLLRIGDHALVAEVASAHRADAFAACAALIEEVKGRLPIWKRQVFDDATEEWVNSP